MKMYTNSEQTAKLIELGFEKPKTIVDKYYDFDAEAYKEVNHYSIGELIEMLPKKIVSGMDDEYADEYSYLRIEEGWDVCYINGLYAADKVIHSKELIDAIYNMLINLKVEGYEN